ncbi:methionine--tRNA ligase [Candidatus Saccharibacteria bacterium]|nr:methionine--tRNA ligase [Candidatus Saccharibacteria bacterium]
MSKSLYLTTAIPYVNGTPHVGHALDYCIADVYYRYQTSLGNQVRFQAGTDEHGNKIAEKAKSAGIPVEEYVTQNSNVFRDFIKKLDVEPTDFIRTTDPDHIRRCQEIWEKISPYIYSSTYEGWYCTGCESFITDKEYEENHGICPDHKTPYENLSEKNYYLKISAFRDKIKSKIESDELKILPEFRKKEILNLIDDAPDVSISRPKKSLTWGIPVPNNEDQVMYVWLDALSNYITVLGFPENDISDFWPADLQVIGKDVLRFHAIIWPTMLLALNLPLPKVILCHGHVLSNGQKMSKSVGNVVNPLDILEKYGSEPFRYFFLRHIDTFADSDFTWEKFDAAYSGELANDLGNLISRLSTLCAKNSVSLIDSKTSLENLKQSALSDQNYKDLMNSFEFSKALDYIWSKIQNLNKKIDEEKPWALAKTNPKKAQESLKNLAHNLVETSFLLAPFLPETAQKIQEIFSQETITPPAPLFPKF